MPVWIVKNKTYNIDSFQAVYLGSLTFGAYDDKILEHLHWLQDQFGPVLGEAVRGAGGLDLKEIMERGFQMGDECHTRFAAATTIFAREMMPHIIAADFDKKTLRSVGQFPAKKDNDWFFGSLMMPACKVMMESAKGIKNSSIVVTLARNGVECGLRVSGLGDQWFTGPADPNPQGILYH